MDDAGARNTGRLAIALAAVAAGSAVSLGVFLGTGGPFGTLNDIGNAATGVLGACLAWRLRRLTPGRLGDVAVGAALLGAGLTIVGSALVISGSTGFFRAGLVSSVGIVGIGAWLLVVNRRADLEAPTRRLRVIGLVAGSLMVLGIVALPGILMGLDDMATAPAWVWISSLGWLGTYVAYPIWAVLLGVGERSPAGRSPTQASIQLAKKAVSRI